MSDRLALIIAVESYQDPAIPPASHAETDAAAVSRALEGLGFGREQQILLLGSQATKLDGEADVFGDLLPRRGTRPHGAGGKRC
jgi:hypothetical protein